MAGNSKRRGAIRKRAAGNPTASSGGRRRQGLEGKGPTPRAEDRPAHKAYRAAKKNAARASQQRRRSTPSSALGDDKPEWIVGRNPVLEALRAGTPVLALHVAERVERDDRVREAIRRSSELGIPLHEVARSELDRHASEAVHQGIAVQIPPYEYADPEDLLQSTTRSATPPLFVALDGVTDPRNLGAVVRSAAAFGAHGVFVPQRRSASMTAAAWKASAGAALRVPVARATNLTRILKSCQSSGLFVVGLDASQRSVELAGLPELSEPVVLVAGAEGKGLSRLVRETCDRLARIPIGADTESLNASVAVGVGLYEVSRHR